jgi:hypothetical protein
VRVRGHVISDRTKQMLLVIACSEDFKECIRTFNKHFIIAGTSPYKDAVPITFADLVDMLKRWSDVKQGTLDW